MKLSDLPTELRMLLQRCPIQPPSTPFDFRLWSRVQTINMLRPLETLFRWTLTLVRKCSRFRSPATDAEKQDTRHPTVLPDLTSES